MPGRLDITALEPFGVEVDADLARDFDGIAKRDLPELLWRHHLLVFRIQTFDFDRQIEVMRLFGPISRTSGEPNPRDYVSKHEEYGRQLGSARLAFHSDLAHCPLPMIALSLFGLDVESNTTSTSFIDSSLVYHQLPPELRERVAGHDALHVFPTSDGDHGQHLRSTGAGGRPVNTTMPYAVHPVVTPHPVTNEPILYVNEMMTDRILGFDDDESEELLTALIERTLAPANVYEHWWNVGDFVIWDNLAIQHGRADQEEVPRRTLRRVVCAEASIYEQCPQMAWVDGHAVLSNYA